jgi:hypothetical protein
MKAIGKELKWALCGFVGGFALCFIVVGALKTSTPTSRVALMQTTTVASSAPIIIHLNAHGRDLKPVPVFEPGFRDNPFKKTPELRNVPRGTLPESYSVDLIDGRDRRP